MHIFARACEHVRAYARTCNRMYACVRIPEYMRTHMHTSAYCCEHPKTNTGGIAKRIHVLERRNARLLLRRRPRVKRVKVVRPRLRFCCVGETVITRRGKTHDTFSAEASNSKRVETQGGSNHEHYVAPQPEDSRNKNTSTHTHRH